MMLPSGSVGPIDRISDLESGEIPLYEGFFESGFRDQIPSLVTETKVVRISPGQLNPPSWRTLITMQNIGENRRGSIVLFYLSFEWWGV